MMLAIQQWQMTRAVTKEGLRQIGQEVKPVSKTRRFFKFMGKLLLWTLLIVLVVGTFVVLAWLNYRLDLESRLVGPWAWARRIWLPLLFGIFCVLCILGMGLWKLLGPERETSEFADIDEAWNDALKALDQAGIDLSRTPLFLVLGRPSGNIDTLFGATRLPFLVRQVPRRGQSPLHVYARKDAVYVTCPDTCLLGRQAAMLAGEDQQEKAGDVPTIDRTLIGSLLEQTALHAESESPPSNGHGQRRAQPVGIAESENLLADEAEPDTENLLSPSSSGGGVVLAEAPALAAPPRRLRRPLLKRATEVEQVRTRFRYLCRVLRRTRRPFCPVNGILLLLPLASTSNDEDAADTGTVCRMDLTIARTVLATDCPIFSMVCDCEALPGYREFLEQVPEAHRQRLLGQAFPLVPNVEPNEVPRMLTSGVQWLCQSLMVLVYRFFQIEHDNESARQVGRANTRLYRLYGVLQERQERLCRILTQAVVPEQGRSLFFGGCYLAATGNGPGQQAFAAGVLRLLVENQNYVTWTPEALAEEYAYQRWTRIGYTSMAVFTVALAVLAFWRLRSGGGE